MDTQADRRRRAFIRFLESRHLTKGGLARETGISPNIVYNFLGGKSRYLSQPTLERIAAYYAVPLSILTGADSDPVAAGLHEDTAPALEAPPARLPTGIVSLDVQGMVMGNGIWMESLFSPVEPARILLPVPTLYAESAFALRLSESSTTTPLPAGAYLGCVAIKDYLQRPVSGDLVVTVQRNRVGLFECSVRAYRVEHDRHFLVDNAKKTRKDHKVELFAPLSDPAALGYQAMFMHSVVLAYAANLPASHR